MTVLVDWEIQSWIKAEYIKVDPFDPSLINSNSLDLRLGNSFTRYLKGDLDAVLDPYDEISIRESTEEIIAKEIVLNPGDCVLGTTLETISLPDCIVGELSGKSSIARLFLPIHQTGGFIDAGFQGEITLEMENRLQRKTKLYAGMPIAQLIFEKTARAENPYGKRSTSKYQNQKGATLSRYHKNKGV